MPAALHAAPGRAARPGRSPAAAAVLGVAIALIGSGALVTALQDDARTLAANLVELVSAAAGGLGCLRAARRTRGSARRGWAALAVACWSWGAGQLVWTVYESVLGIPSPYPSAADIGYLVFPVAALVGLVFLAPDASGFAAPRRVLDALMVGCALGVLSWIAVLERIVRSADGSGFALSVSLAYPVADVVLLTVTVLTVAQTRDEPLRWGLLGVGVLAMALSDSAFAYQIGDDTYATGAVAEVGWWAAFALIGAAGLLAGGAVPSAPSARHAARAGLLPYLPLAAAVVVSAGEELQGIPLGRVALGLIVALVFLVLARQYVTVRENQDLVRTVAQREVELHRLAFHDGLTGLANRALFLDRLEHALELAARESRPVSVAFLDLDGFKAVNDSLGHATGDVLLVRVAERLLGAIRVADTLARLGGDEFAVLVEQGDATVVAGSLLRALRAPFRLDGRAVAVSASVGVATVDPGKGPADAAALLHRADVAMYAVKSAGKGGVAVHSPAMTDSPAVRTNGTSGGRDLDRAFVAALDAGEIRAVYQPVVDPVSGHMQALEALARWTHDGVAVGPDTFVPICVRAGLSEQLTALMLEHACGQLNTWNRALGHRRLRVAVNVDPTEFTDTGLPARIAALLTRHDLAPAQLVLEVTEVGMSNRPETMLDVMAGLREAGVRLALDDFGTGYNSLARLSSTPLDTVKIDRFFVADIDHDLRQRRFLIGLFQLTRHLGLRTVAEGVERPGQLRELSRLGCDLVQGHLLARPAPAEEITPLVLAERPLVDPHILRRPG
ncbi:EAL domain-containing protein [Pseudonocardia sp.]|uniref:putative bifunctional diguanylate cyclase/phosphodiesterase n=1 Tax=Pseudonocardia sp. TaxID=60912 RepID=UPI002621BD8A|nr:EAL domain-containing protein [Pseudonocardia sp.]